jgi:hypothetical protein
VGIVGLLISLFYVLSAQRRGVVVAPRERVVERDPYVDPYV